MTRDEVLQMAREAGLFDDHAHMYEAEIIRFAHLVEQRTKPDAERYRFLRSLALNPSLGLESFVAINQLDFQPDSDSFDSEIDKAIRSTSHLKDKP